MCTLLQIQLILTYRIQARFLHHHAGRSFRELFRDTHGYRQFIYAFLHVPPSVYGPWNVDILCWTYTEEVILHHSSDTHISSGGHIYRLVHMGILTLLLLGIESLYRKPRVRSVAPASRPRPTDICHSQRRHFVGNAFFVQWSSQNCLHCDYVSRLYSRKRANHSNDSFCFLLVSDCLQPGNILVLESKRLALHTT